MKAKAIVRKTSKGGIAEAFELSVITRMKAKAALRKISKGGMALMKAKAAAKSTGGMAKKL